MTKERKKERKKEGIKESLQSVRIDHEDDNIHTHIHTHTDQFIYFGSNISSTESGVNIGRSKAWDYYRLVIGHIEI